jgi:hypothetical protein
MDFPFFGCYSRVENIFNNFWSALQTGFVVAAASDTPEGYLPF